MVNAEVTPQRARSSSVTQPKPKVLRPFNTAEVKVLLLENVNETAVKSFQRQGYQVRWMHTSKLDEVDEMIDLDWLYMILGRNVCQGVGRWRADWKDPRRPCHWDPVQNQAYETSPWWSQEPTVYWMLLYRHEPSGSSPCSFQRYCRLQLAF